VLLVTNNEDTAVVLKNLTIQSQNAAQPLESNEKRSNNTGMVAPYAYLSILSIATFAAAIVYVKKKKQMVDKKQANKVHHVDSGIHVPA
jgi:hypothetical protein